MADWTEDDIFRIDRQFASEGLHPQARPFRAAMELLGQSFVVGVMQNPEVDRIIKRYHDLIPETVTTLPGQSCGLIASGESVKRVAKMIVFGSARVDVFRGLGFSSHEDWWVWCRRDDVIASRSVHAFSDIFDVMHGFDELKGENPIAMERWKLALSNLDSLASTLSVSFRSPSATQQICMVAELSMKAAIIFFGDSVESTVSLGHHLKNIWKRLSILQPHRDDAVIESLLVRFPHYVDSRYSETNLNRLELIELALAAQFIAASSVRRSSKYDLAISFEQDTRVLNRAYCFGLQ